MYCIVPYIILSLCYQTMKQTMLKQLSLVLMILTAHASMAQKQGVGVDTLYNAIRKTDSLVFTAFNKRDEITFSAMFAKDLEFFHDKSGLTGYDNTVDFLKRLTADKSDLRRDLLPETLEVYPVPGYGAMEIGQHRFTHSENGKTETAVFKFVHVWKFTGGQWQITRVVSYGH